MGAKSGMACEGEHSSMLTLLREGKEGGLYGMSLVQESGCQKTLVSDAYLNGIHHTLTPKFLSYDRTCIIGANIHHTQLLTTCPAGQPNPTWCSHSYGR